MHVHQEFLTGSRYELLHNQRTGYERWLWSVIQMCMQVYCYAAWATCRWLHNLLCVTVCALYSQAFVLSVVETFRLLLPQHQAKAHATSSIVK